MKKSSVTERNLSQTHKGTEFGARLSSRDFPLKLCFRASVSSAPLRLCAGFFLIIFFASCATPPKAGPAPGDGTPDFSILPAGADIYLWADVVRARPLLDALSFAGLKGTDASQILDRTDTVLAALYPEGSPRRYFLAAWGNYPKLSAGASLGFSRDWKKIKSETGNRYWHSKSYMLGVALGSDLVFASDGDPFAPPSGSGSAPDGFEDFRRPCVFSGWLNNPGAPLNSFMDGLGIPLQIPAEDFFFGVERLPAAVSPADSGQWELVFAIRTPSASHARSLLSLFSMARFFVMMGAAGIEDDSYESGSSVSPMELAALLFANSPEQNEDFLTLRIGPLSEERIALLLAMFQTNQSFIKAE